MPRADFAYPAMRREHRVLCEAQYGATRGPVLTSRMAVAGSGLPGHLCALDDHRQLPWSAPSLPPPVLCDGRY
eukprot:1902818-Rhodomonas_salina.1